MRLERIRIEMAPGLSSGLPEIELPPGLVVIVGPNGSGKSTLVRAVLAMLGNGSADTRLRAS